MGPVRDKPHEEEAQERQRAGALGVGAQEDSPVPAKLRLELEPSEERALSHACLPRYGNCCGPRSALEAFYGAGQLLRPAQKALRRSEERRVGKECRSRGGREE